MPNDQPPVLFAYDGSEYARTAIEQAARELRPGRHAIVLTVSTPLAVSSFAGAAVPLPADLEDQSDADARATAEEGAELARRAGFEAAAVSARGEPTWRRIVEAADDVGASVIVLGSHGRSGLSAVIMGSVAEAVSRHTDRTVLIVHLPAQREPANEAG
jgi:nucleotide-binding universal stress UspA family protein